MNLRPRLACFPALVMLALLPLRPAQTGAPTSPSAAQNPVNLHVDLVVMDAEVVQRKTGHLVGGLNKDDFTLYEDGVKQQITQFGQDTLPLSVVLMVDRAGCLDPFTDQVRQATLAALNRLKPTDEVALLGFAENTQMIEDFTYDRKRIADAVSRMPNHDENANHCFNSTFYDAASFVRRASNPAGRRVLVMITAATRDLMCETGPSTTDARNALLESGAVVCGLIPSLSGERVENGIFGGLAWMFKLPSSTLSQFVEETGGEVFKDKPAELDHAFGTLIDHLRNRYTIGFVSSNTKRDGTYRKLKLLTASGIHKREGDVSVITRRGYLSAQGSAKSAP
jgi:Ca-activated chloride channel family protein